MEIGDLVRIIYRGGAINNDFGLYLGISQSLHRGHWLRFFIDGEVKELYEYDFRFEVLNGGR